MTLMESLAAIKGLVVAPDAPSSQVIFRVLDDDPLAGEVASDRRTEEVAQLLNRSKIPAASQLRGAAIWICLCLQDDAFRHEALSQMEGTIRECVEMARSDAIFGPDEDTGPCDGLDQDIARPWHEY